MSEAAQAQPAPSLDAATLRRLAFLKFVYSRGRDAARLPEPLSSAALLNFHDAVELFLDLTAEHVDAQGASGLEFMGYWNLLNPHVKDGVAHKEAMRRLNDARKGLKHHGTFASGAVVDEMLRATERFFIDNTPRVFGIEFGAVSLIEAVSYPAVREKLHTAQAALESGDVKTALSDAAVGFERLLDDYEETKRTRFGRSPFFFGESMSFMSSFHMGLGRSGGWKSDPKDRKLGEFVDTVTKSLEAMRDAMKLMSLGVDYRRYARFRLLAPSVSRVFGDEEYSVGWGRETYVPTADDAQFCIDFVIESALRLQEFDYTVEAET